MELMMGLLAMAGVAGGTLGTVAAAMLLIRAIQALGDYAR